MKFIGLISDTHNFIHPKTYNFFKEVDEIWHAGDIGSMEVIDALLKFKPLRAVFGNIDSHDIRSEFPEDNVFMCEEAKIFMTHIGGYPNRYQAHAKSIIIQQKPDLFISGHSHILKVMHDPKYNLLHINPGAAGKSGFHKVITLVRFRVEGKTFKDLEILEIPRNP
ncbi:MAG: metallophosphoesterase family protein [Bacteroidales bacterium]|nr:metallophosphoesterase family protein [Bacteroidales bacterium]